MSSLNRHDAGQLLDYALRLRLAGHAIKQPDLSKPFIRRAKRLEKRALLLLGADAKFQASLQQAVSSETSSASPIATA